MDYKATVNGNRQFDIAVNDNVSVNGETVILDILNLSDRRASVIYQNQSFNIEIVGLDQRTKTCSLKVNGSSYVVELKDQYDALLERLGIDASSAQKIQEVKAPMPGLVLNLHISEGDEVKKGDNLLVLEAMKMENMIKSPTDGIISKIEISKGDKVEKNQNLIRFK